MYASADIAELYRTHGSAVLRRARAILGSETDAREVLQDVFVSLVARPEQFAGRSSAMTFLYRATTNRCLNHIRNSRNRLRLVETHASHGDERDARASPETRTVVTELLQILPDELARVIVYYYIDEMSHAEIAELIGCSRRHVGNLLARFHRDHADFEEHAPC